MGPLCASQAPTAARGPSRRRSPARPASGGAPAGAGSHSCSCVLALFQWLKQIEVTEAALTQKMLDLEKEKVKDPAPGTEEAEGAWGLAPREGWPVLSRSLFASVSIALALLWVTNYQLHYSLTVDLGSLCYPCLV